MRTLTCSLSAIAALLLTTAAIATPVTWKLDPKASGLHARTFKDGVASGFAHDHVIEATEVDGKVTLDPGDPSTFTIEITVQTASLKADDPRLRHAYGLDGEIDADDRETIEESMKDDEQLDVKRYPTIRFVSTAVKQTAPGKYAIEGELTLRGKTRAVKLTADVTIGGGRFEGKGKLSINHTAFGFEPYSAMLGAVKNKNRIDLHLHVVAGP